jgi:hypothetical protein
LSGNNKIPDYSTFGKSLKETKFYIDLKYMLDNTFAKLYGCLKSLGGCTRKFLAETQYYAGNVTDITKNAEKKLVELYPSLNVRSLVDWKENSQSLGNKIPEFYGFLNFHHDYTNVLFGIPMDLVFNYGYQSVLNDQTIYLMNTFSSDQRASDISHRFSLWVKPEYIVQYINHAFFEWYLGGLFKNFQISEIIFGYEDKDLVRMKKTPALEGGLTSIETLVQMDMAGNYTLPMQLKTGKAGTRTKENLIANEGIG